MFIWWTWCWSYNIKKVSDWFLTCWQKHMKWLVTTERALTHNTSPHLTSPHLGISDPSVNHPSFPGSDKFKRAGSEVKKFLACIHPPPIPEPPKPNHESHILTRGTFPHLPNTSRDFRLHLPDSIRINPPSILHRVSRYHMRDFHLKLNKLEPMSHLEFYSLGIFVRRWEDDWRGAPHLLLEACHILYTQLWPR